MGYRPHPQKRMKNHSLATARSFRSAQPRYTLAAKPLGNLAGKSPLDGSRLRCAAGRWRGHHRALLPCGLPAARAGRFAPSRLVGCLPVPQALRPVASPPAAGVLSSHPLAQPPALATPCSLKVAGESGSGYSRFLSHPLRTSVMS